jgi:hypothetical protein
MTLPEDFSKNFILLIMISWITAPFDSSPVPRTVTPSHRFDKITRSAINIRGEMKPTSQHFPTILKRLVILTAVTTLISLCFLPRCYHRHNSTRWPTTSGVIGQVALKTSFHKPGMTTYFSPFICYRYTVDNIPRASTRIAFAASVGFPKEEALAWIDRNYPLGKQVGVYYDAKNPDLAVLVPGATEQLLICWSSTLTAASCFALSLVLLLREKRRPPSEGLR